MIHEIKKWFLENKFIAFELIENTNKLILKNNLKCGSYHQTKELVDISSFLENYQSKLNINITYSTITIHPKEN